MPLTMNEKCAESKLILSYEWQKKFDNSNRFPIVFVN